MKIRVIRHIANISWQDLLSYRLNLALEVAGGSLFTLVTLWLWLHVAGPSGVGSYQRPELITYILGAGLITSYYFLTGQGDDINDDIAHGNLSASLTRPVNPLVIWFIRDQMRKILTLAVGTLGFVIIGICYKNNIVGPASLAALGTTLGIIVVAGIIHFFLYANFSLLAFWLDQTWGERFFLRVIGELTSGILIPLSLLPKAIETLAHVLPFQFFAAIPMDVYLGKITPTEYWHYLAPALAWAIGLGMVTFFVFRLGLRSYSGEGS